MDDMYLDHLLEPLSTGTHPLRPWHSATIFFDGTRFDITIGQQKFLERVTKRRKNKWVETIRKTHIALMDETVSDCEAW